MLISCGSHNIMSMLEILVHGREAKLNGFAWHFQPVDKINVPRAMHHKPHNKEMPKLLDEVPWRGMFRATPLTWRLTPSKKRGPFFL